jgi:hypothetical protein
MATTPRRPCLNFSRCHNLANGSRCAACARGRDQLRPNADVRRLYKTARWRQLRAVVIQEEPLCCDCLAADRSTPTTDVDHQRRTAATSSCSGRARTYAAAAMSAIRAKRSGANDATGDRVTVDRSSRSRIPRALDQPRADRARRRRVEVEAAVARLAHVREFLERVDRHFPEGVPLAITYADRATGCSCSRTPLLQRRARVRRSEV